MYFEFICPACNINQYHASNLNKHLNICKEYDKWLKTYKPPTNIEINTKK